VIRRTIGLVSISGLQGRNKVKINNKILLYLIMPIKLGIQLARIIQKTSPIIRHIHPGRTAFLAKGTTTPHKPTAARNPSNTISKNTISNKKTTASTTASKTRIAIKRHGVVLKPLDEWCGGGGGDVIVNSFNT